MLGASVILAENTSATIKSDFKDDFLDIASPYYVKIFNDNSRNTPTSFDVLSVGYKNLDTGHVIMAYNKKQKELAFDMSDDGRLIVRSEDANLYSVDNRGHLIYGVTSGGIGEMIIESTFIVE